MDLMQLVQPNQRQSRCRRRGRLPQLFNGRRLNPRTDQFLKNPVVLSAVP